MINSVKGVLSDMDGTLIESTPAVEATWAQFAQDYPFISLEDVLKHSHGVRTHENVSFVYRLPQYLTYTPDDSLL